MLESVGPSVFTPPVHYSCPIPLACIDLSWGAGVLETLLGGDGDSKTAHSPLGRKETG